MTTPNYVTWFTSLLPGPLAGPWGRRWAGVVGAVGGDELLADAKVAVKARFPDLAPEDALPKVGADRVLPACPAKPSPRGARASPAPGRCGPGPAPATGSRWWRASSASSTTA